MQTAAIRAFVLVVSSPTFWRQCGSLTAIQFVDLLHVLGAEFPLEHRPHLIRRVGFHQHGGPAVAVTERTVFVVHDGRQVVREVLRVGLVECVFFESALHTYQIIKVDNLKYSEMRTMRIWTSRDFNKSLNNHRRMSTAAASFVKTAEIDSPLCE